MAKHLQREVIAYKTYFLDFYHKQSDDVQKKIEWTLNLIRVTHHVPDKYFKHIKDVKGLYEIRVEAGKKIYRIFSFFDKFNIVVLGNAFQKKTNKTPKQEIEKATKIMEAYFNEKGKDEEYYHNG